MTNQETIKNHLQGKGWVSGRELQIKLIYQMNPETVARECRRLSEKGEIIKDIKDGFVQYQLTSGQVRMF